MGKLIIILPKAELDLENITDYLFAEFGNRIKKRFLDRFAEVCDIISDNPQLYTIANKKRKIRKCVLTKQSTVYFRIYANRVEVLAVFDTRQNPKKLKGIL